MPFSDPQGVPASTYRLQLRKEFPFAAASGLVPYLKQLGISTCYTSPILMSAAGSTHGYDVNDYHRIDTELGSREGFDEFARQVRAHGMGILLDFVPNHMGIEGSQNRWWHDVLECGPQSPHADFFDIDWRDPYAQGGRPRVLVPILGDHYGVMLEDGKFALTYGGGAFHVTYEGMRFPLGIHNYSELLSGAAESLTASAPEKQDGAERVSVSAADELRAIADAFHTLVDAATGKIIERAPRHDLKRRLAKLTGENEAARLAIEAHLAQLNGTAGQPRSLDRLDALLNAQHYRLAHWKTGAHEVNYRRFFAIDTLIGLRMENPRVFEDTHRLIGSLIRENFIAGLRIDHVDGLRNPLEYLERVQALAVHDGVAAARPFYVVVEKILAEGEELDSAWPTHGTTGYEFIGQLAGLLVDARAEGQLTDLYADFTGERDSYANVVYAEKRLVLEEMFANAVTQLAHQLANLVAADRRWRDLTRYDLTVAIREIMACLGVYRLYRRMNAECRPADAREVDRACAEAIRRNPRRDAQPFTFVRDLLVGRYPPPSATVDFRVGLWRWVLTFQQYTGAVMAKSVEDTAFYDYNRFIALNEVGGHPATFGRTVAEFHADNARRRALTPHTLLATSTHDTKFGEDARARLYALSEIPDEWARWVTEWRRLNRRHKTRVGLREAPDANEEYRLYQTLLGCWPPAETLTRSASNRLGAERVSVSEGFEPDDAFRQRLREHWHKAANEAKRNTRWAHPDEKWLEAGDHFLDALLAPGSDFLASFRPKVARLAQLGVVNSLTQVALKILSPGVPDFYQGCEYWNFSLVDPDNRRLVEWSGAEESLASARAASWPELLETWPDGRVKQRLTADLLRFRQHHLALFQQGDYEPLQATGEFAEHVVAFRRCHGRECVVVIVPRLVALLGETPVGDAWGDTTLALPRGWARWRSVLGAHGEPGAERVSVSAPASRGSETLTRSAPISVLESVDTWRSDQPAFLRELFAELPLAVLVGDHE